MGYKKQALYENKDEVIRLSKEGKSNAFIGAKFGCSGALVGLFLKDCDIISRQLKNARDADLTKFKEEITGEYEKGKSVGAIAKDMSLRSGLVNSYLKRWGYDTSGGRGTYKGEGFVKDYTEEIIKMYMEEKVGIEIIGHRMGCGSASIRRILQKHNLMRSWEDVRYQVDQSYFEKIDSRNKAYIFGFLMADGNIDKNLKAWRIALKYDDVEILEKIKKEIGYTGELRYIKERKYKKKNGEWSVGSAQYMLSVSRNKMCRDLVKLGCMPNKTWQIRFPAEDILPKKFIPDFCRGYWDGDGSIAKKGPALSIIGNKFFVSEMMKRLPIKEMPPAFYQQSEKYTDDPDKQLLHQTISIRHGCFDVFKFLYGNCQDFLYLERKYRQAKIWLADL